MVEQQDGVPLAESLALLPGEDPFTPSPRLRQALENLRKLLHEELGERAAGKRHWLLLEGAGGTPVQSLEVGKVLEELRLRFADLQHQPAEPAQAALESYLREKMRQLGFEDLPLGPLLPELQREALRGLGVGLGSQIAQLLGKQAGWHGEAKSASPDQLSKQLKASAPIARLLRLELSPRIAASKTDALQLRSELARARKNLSQFLGWEISALHLVLAKEYPGTTWRLVLRGAEIASGEGIPDLLERFETTLLQHASELLTFAEFDAMSRQPSCRAVVKELRCLGLERATLWTLFRQRLAHGGDLCEPSLLFERLLEASIISLDPEHLLESLLSI